MRTADDCKAYIDKLEFFSTNSSDKLFVSASKHGYGNTNYVVDDVRHEDYDISDKVRVATNGLAGAGVPPSSIAYLNGIEPCSGPRDYLGRCTNGYLSMPHITTGTNVAGYISWGAHSTLGGQFAANGLVHWQSASRWWIIETIESFNGQRDNSTTYQSNFLEWFSATGFGGTNYSNTPVGAVTHVDEPQLYGANTSDIYFGLWARGKCFGSAAWNSRVTPAFQAVGDPFITR